MFIKTITKTDKKTGVVYNYFRLVESYRIAGKPRHRTILHIGKIDNLPTDKFKLLADTIEELLKKGEQLFVQHIDPQVNKLARKYYQQIVQNNLYENIKSKQKNSDRQPEKEYVSLDINSIRDENSREIGGEWLCKQAIEQLELKAFFKGINWNQKEIETAMISLTSKLLYPCSEYKTEKWIKQNSGVVELYGVKEKYLSRHHLYSINRKIYANQNAIEEYLSQRTRDLFNLKEKIILYDLTNTYFEGNMTGSQTAQFGRSKEKRGDAKLISLAIVTDELGFIKWSKLYPGNISEPKTMTTLLTEMDRRVKREGIQEKPTVVMDAGIATESNIYELRRNGYPYICVSRRKMKGYTIAEDKLVRIEDNKHNSIFVQKLIVDYKKPKEVENSIKEEEKGIKASNESKEGNEKEQELYLYVKSDGKKLKEDSMHKKQRTRYEASLEDIRNSVTKLRGIKDLEKVNRRIGRLMEKYPGMNKYFKIDIKNEGNIVTGINWEYTGIDIDSPEDSGVYFIRTSHITLSENGIWEIYNSLREVESTFRTLKTDLSIRPVFHQNDNNAEAHIFLGVLAYQVVASIRHQLKFKGINSEWREIVRIMNTQKATTTSFVTDEDKKMYFRKCSRPNEEVTKIYDALKLKSMPFHNKKM